MTASAAIPTPPSSTRRYLSLTPDGWRITTPAPPADYHLLHSWPRGEDRRLDLEVTDDGDGWRLSVVAFGPTDIVVGRGEADLLAAMGFFLPLPRHFLVEVFA